MNDNDIKLWMTVAQCLGNLFSMASVILIVWFAAKAWKWGYDAGKKAGGKENKP